MNSTTPNARSENTSTFDVSVIVPLHRDNERFRYALGALIELESDATYEVIVVSDRTLDLPPEVLHVISGSSADTSPAEKRDIAAAHARGQVLAFIDDDAYPCERWIDRALQALDDPLVAAVGGPGLTPPDSPWRERLGGAVYESRLGSGPLRERFVSDSSSRDAVDLPAFNLFVRTQALTAIGGWDSTFYGGEDTKLCHELLARGFRLRYEPSIAVYHFRRPILAGHLKQIGNVGRHRGFFVKRFPATSRRFVYFLPSIGVALLPVALGVAVICLGKRPLLTLTSLAVAWLLIAVTAFRRVGIATILFPAVLAAHHVVYGLQFIRGLATRSLTR